jgi:hypothetical protein
MTLKRFALPALLMILAAGGPGVAKSLAAPLPAEPAAYGQEPWENAPREFNEIQRRGFRDGIEGAHRDFDNHRRPDVDNREEYRDPHAERELREAYRAAYRRGYEVAASHLWGAPPPPPPPVAEPPHSDWNAWGMRGLENDAERQGYREGTEEARKDLQMHNRIDPDDSDEFRHPHVPPGLADEFREGFMRGYEVTVSQMSGEPSWEGRGDPGQWRAPERFTEMQRRGFQEGVEGARRDFGNHRRPNVANRDEYRQPHVAPEFRHEYREGFRHGYEMAAARLWGGM